MRFLYRAWIIGQHVVGVLMIGMLVVVVHIIGGIGALSTGFLALRFPNGTLLHRRLGKAYLAAWGALFVTGIIIGGRRPGVSVFDILNMLGFGAVLLGYSLVLFRRRLGQWWLSLHYNCMITSLSFVVVATANQLLPRLGITYPWWGVIVLGVLPFFVIPPYIARLNQRYTRQKAPVQTQLLK